MSSSNPNTEDSIVLERAWKQSGANGVKQFNTVMKQERKDNGTFDSIPDSFQEITKFLSKNSKKVITFK